MARHTSRRDALEEAIRLRDEAARLYAKLDGLVQTLIAEEAAAQRQAHVPLELLRPASPAAQWIDGRAARAAPLLDR
jgi:hypothetical protein